MAADPADHPRWNGTEILPYDAPIVDEVEADAGERFDPFCHTLDDQGHALCFADVRGRRAHARKLPSTSATTTTMTCLTCNKVICPTCLEIEYRLPEKVAS